MRLTSFHSSRNGTSHSAKDGLWIDTNQRSQCCVIRSSPRIHSAKFSGVISSTGFAQGSFGSSLLNHEYARDRLFGYFHTCKDSPGSKADETRTWQMKTVLNMTQEYEAALYCSEGQYAEGRKGSSRPQLEAPRYLQKEELFRGKRKKCRQSIYLPNSKLALGGSGATTIRSLDCTSSHQHLRALLQMERVQTYVAFINYECAPHWQQSPHQPHAYNSTIIPASTCLPYAIRSRDIAMSRWTDPTQKRSKKEHLLCVESSRKSTRSQSCWICMLWKQSYN